MGQLAFLSFCGPRGHLRGGKQDEEAIKRGGVVISLPHFVCLSIPSHPTRTPSYLLDEPLHHSRCCHTHLFVHLEPFLLAGIFHNSFHRAGSKQAGGSSWKRPWIPQSRKHAGLDKKARGMSRTERSNFVDTAAYVAGRRLAVAKPDMDARNASWNVCKRKALLRPCRRRRRVLDTQNTLQSAASHSHLFLYVFYPFPTTVPSPSSSKPCAPPPACSPASASPKPSWLLPSPVPAPSAASK